MSDEQNHNDPLERLFRKKSEEYDISYREEDWLNLEKQLDTRDMKLFYRRRLRWLAAASILILSLIGYYTIQNHNKINQLTEQLNQREQIQQNAQSANSNSQEDLARAENESNKQFEQNVISEGNENSVTPNENESSRQNRFTDVTVDDTSESSAVAEEGQRSQFGNLSRRRFAEATQTIRERPVAPNEFFPTHTLILASGSFENQPQPVEVRVTGSESGYRSNSGESNISSSAMINGPVAIQNGFNASENRYPAESNLAIGIVVSPDLSTAGGVSNFYNPGFKGGLLAEYSLSKHFSLISGVTISNLKYKAEGEAYNPPGAWNYGQMPDQTRAICVVLDIPLNLKANLFNFDRSRIFATAGLSSYIMLNEDYRFRYDGDATGLQTSWNDATGTRHWFSNAGFSIGIEYDLSPNWSLRAEPHFKVPLKGVGWGEVELYSMGSFLSLNYRFGSL